MTIQWMYYPKSDKAPQLVVEVVDAFQMVAPQIDSRSFEYASNIVLSLVRPELERIGFVVEAGKTRDQRIQVPVLFGLNGKLEKSFDADAYHSNAGFVVEVEAGRAVVNYQFLKDFFQACMMHDVKYLAIAVRNLYRDRNDFELVLRFFDTMFASNRLSLPLDGILIIGY